MAENDKKMAYLHKNGQESAITRHCEHLIKWKNRKMVLWLIKQPVPTKRLPTVLFYSVSRSFDHLLATLPWFAAVVYTEWRASRLHRFPLFQWLVGPHMATMSPLKFLVTSIKNQRLSYKFWILELNKWMTEIRILNTIDYQSEISDRGPKRLDSSWIQTKL